jgi:hypothetical protein
MQTLLRISFFCIYAPTIICSLILLFIIENKPSETISYPLNTTDIKQIKVIFRKIRSSNSDVKTLRLTQKNLNNLVNHFLNRYFEIATKIILAKDEVQIKVSLHLPKNNFGHYLNFHFKLKHQYNILFTPHSLHIGHLAIADEWSQFIFEILFNYLPFKDIQQSIKKMLKLIQITSQDLTLVYDSKSIISNNISTSLLSVDQQTLAFYQQKIVNIIKAHDPAWRLSLAELLQPLFEVAHQRSNLETAINENKIIIITVAHYVNQSEIQRYLPSGDKPQYAAYLYRRRDMAKHFMTSALLTTVGNGSLAIMLGEEKELRDAKLGSGFSFIDLAGDRAGIRFGQMATDSPESARRLQKLMAKIKDYRVFMPEVRDLPENITDEAFKKKFGSIYSPRYQLILKKIDTRINALPIYQLR